MKHEFIYNGMNSTDYGLTISGEDTWKRPKPDITRISVPGRNGDLIQLGNRFENVEIEYHAGIVKDMSVHFDAFNARLLSDPGYHILEDSYHPEYYRLAVFEDALVPEVKNRLNHAEVDIKFNCKPQLFLKSGLIEQAISNNGIIYNPTPYNALPKVEFGFMNSWEGGSITINGITISSQNPESVGPFVIDCEKQDIYKKSDMTNCNSLFTLDNQEFFVLYPGRNTIYFTSVSAFTIIPNWWTV